MADNRLQTGWQKLSKGQQWSVVLFALFVLYTLFGFLVLPAIVRTQLEKQLSTALNRKTTVAQVKINPYTLQAAINGFVINDLAGSHSFVAFDSLKVNVQAASLFKRAVVVKSVALINPYVNVELYEDLIWNFSDLLTSEDEPETEKEPGRPLSFSINNISITGGEIYFADSVKGVQHDITGLHLGIPFLSNLDYEVDIFTEPAFEATINGTPLSMAGASKPFDSSRHTELDITFSNIDLVDYVNYLPDMLHFDVKKGLLDLDLAFSFMQHEDGNPAVNIKGSVSLHDLELLEQDGTPLLTLHELAVDVDRAHILRREFHLAGVYLRQPELVLRRMPDGQLNLASLFAGQNGQQGGQAAAGEETLLEVKEAVIDEAVLHFTDLTVADPFQTTLDPLDVQVHNFSTSADRAADFQYNLAIQSGEKVAGSGTFSVTPLTVRAQIDVGGIRPETYHSYYEKALAAELKAENIGAQAAVEFAPEDNVFLIKDLAVEINDLSLVGDRPEEKIAVPYFAIKESTVDLQGKNIFVGKCLSDRGVVPLVRRQDGTVNVQDFLAGHPANADMEPENETTDENTDGSGWNFVLQRLELADYAVTFTDHVPRQSAIFKADELRLSFGNITNKKGEKGEVDLSLRLNEKGRLKAFGSVAISPLALNLNVDAADVPLKISQSYVSENLNVIIGDGSAALVGTLTAEQQENVSLHFFGTISSSAVSFLESGHAEKLFSWDELVLRELEVDSNPLRVAVGEVSLDGLHAMLRVDEGGKLNLGSISKEKKEEEADSVLEEKAEAPPDMEVRQVMVSSSSLEFADHNITPAFSATLEDIQGTISGLTSRKDSPATVEVAAKLNRHSSLNISGTIQPWQNFFTDVSVDFNDIELSGLTPYSVKFIGYPLSKGKLNLALHYLIEGKKLTSNNKAFIDQITLGKFVENDTAVDLPIQLAISLLQNRKGEIDLDIPVSGSLDDPQFSVAGVVFKIIGNLILKAATSPFSLLGALFEGGEDMQYVQFRPGLSAISSQDREVLEKLAKALYDRPRLKLDLTGYVDVEADRQALTQMRFDRLLKSEKLKDLVKKGQSVAEVGSVDISPEEYDYYLKQAYKSADFKRPRNFLGFLKKQPPAVMEEMLISHIAISDDDLRQLAMERAKLVKDMLVKQGPVEPQRVFLVEPESLQGKDTELPLRRVDMVLK